MQTGGTYSALSKAGATPLMRITMTGVTLGPGAATGASWACIEGNFGTSVGASMCGHYNFGPDLTNQSTYTPTTTGGTVTIGGDDGAIGPPHSLASQFSNMTALAVTGAPAGYQWYCLSTRSIVFDPTTTPLWNFCADDSFTLSGSDDGKGNVFLFQTEAPIPPAVWLFGSALGVMGVMRRKSP